MRMLISLPLRGRGRLRPGPGGSTRERDMAARAPGGGRPGLDGTAARHLRAAVHPPLRPHVTPGKTGGWWQRTEPFWCLKDGGGGDRQLTADRYLRPLSRSAVRCGDGRRLRTASRLSAGWRGLRQSIRRFSSRLAWRAVRACRRRRRCRAGWRRRPRRGRRRGGRRPRGRRRGSPACLTKMPHPSPVRHRPRSAAASCPPRRRLACQVRCPSRRAPVCRGRRRARAVRRPRCRARRCRP